jgi:hypothetical protein
MRILVGECNDQEGGAILMFQGGPFRIVKEDKTIEAVIDSCVECSKLLFGILVNQLLSEKERGHSALQLLPCTTRHVDKPCHVHSFGLGRAAVAEMAAADLQRDTERKWSR